MAQTAKISAAERQLRDDMGSFTHDPYQFVLYSFPWCTPELPEAGPDTWQQEELESIGEQLRAGGDAGCIILRVVASGHGIGKSSLVAWLVLWALSTCPDCRGDVTANKFDQLKTKTWAELAKWYNLFIARHWLTLTATSIYANEPDHDKLWRIDMMPWSVQNTAAFAGLHNKGKRILRIFDEGSEIPDAIYDVSEGSLTDEGTEIIWLVFGNPTLNTGKFRTLFNSPRWQHRQIDSRTSKFTNKDLLQQQIDDYGIDSDFCKVRIRGMFPSMSAKQFFSVADVDAAFGRHLRDEQYNFAPRILTCDPAWEGDDLLIIAMRQGLAFQVLRTIPKNDNDIEIANILARVEDDEEVDQVFIDNGYGTGIISAGRTWGRSWQGVWFGGKSTTQACKNKRAEMAMECKTWLKQGGAIPPDNDLYTELTSIEAIPDTGGVIQLESKRDFKQRIGRSPDRLDSLLLSFAFPVSKKEKGYLGKSQGGGKLVSDYDPIGGA